LFGGLFVPEPDGGRSDEVSLDEVERILI